MCFLFTILPFCLATNKQYNLHESRSFALFTHQFLESGPQWAQLTDSMNKSHVLLGEECFNDWQLFLKILLLFLACYFVLFHAELVLVILTMPQVFQVDLFCVLLRKVPWIPPGKVWDSPSSRNKCHWTKRQSLPRKIVPNPEDKVSHGDTPKKNLPKAVSQIPLGKDITSVGICLKISNVESKTLRNCGLDNIVVY